MTGGCANFSQGPGVNFGNRGQEFIASLNASASALGIPGGGGTSAGGDGGGGMDCPGGGSVVVQSGSGPAVPEPPLYILICVTVLYTFIFIAGVLGNALVVFVVWRNHDMRNSTNFFLVNLSIADLLVIAVCMPSAFVDLFAKEVWYLGAAMCKIVPFLENAVSLASVLTILAISFERYYAICHPLKAQYTCTFRRMLKVVAAVWLVAICASGPFFEISVLKDSEFVDGTPIKVCRAYIVHTWKQIYIVLMTVVFFLLPLLILVVLYIIISINLMRDRSLTTLRSDQVSNSNLQARRQVVLMLAAVVLLFFVCLFPIKVVGIWTICTDKAQVKKLGLEGYLNLIYFARVMLYLNSSINPICYNMMSSKFRGAFRRALGLRHPTLQRKGTLVTSLSSSRPVTYAAVDGQDQTLL